MKNGLQNKIRSAPPIRSAAEALAGLDKVQDWTEQPAKDAASAIAPSIDTVVTQMPAEPSVARFPWDEALIGSAESVKLVNFKIPMRLYLKLKYLGDTTYDSSMTKIVVSTLEHEIERLLKDRQP